MGWLGTRLRKKPSEEEEVVEEELAPEPPSGPPLVLLVPEIAGGSSYRMYQFHELEPAIELIESTIPAIRAGIHAFWALQERPLDSTDIDPKGEGLVLIRSGPGSSVVYVVSFVDIESGESFARFEVKRGLDVGLLLIYWAAHVEIDQTGAGFTLNPPEPPLTASSKPRPLRDWNAAAPAASSQTAPVAEPELPPVESSRPSQAAPGQFQPDAANAAEEAREAEERHRLREAGAAGVVEVDVDEPESSPPALEMAPSPPGSENGNAHRTVAPLATPDAQPTAEPEAEAPAEQPVAFAGDEEIADRILQEALGDTPIRLTLQPDPAPEAPPSHAADSPPAPKSIKAQEANQDPELDLFNGPPRTSRARRKTPPETTPEVEAALAHDAAPEPPPEPDPAPPPEPDPAPAPAIAAEAPVEAPLPQDARAENSAPAVAEQLATEETPVFKPARNAAAEPTPAAEPPAFRPAAGTATEPGRALQTAAPGETGTAEATGAEAPVEDDAVAQVAKILRIPRWEKREDPFKGFNSPPGRF